MALALRLTALSYVVAHAHAQWLHSSPGSSGRAPVTTTAEPTALSLTRPWSPKTTAAPDRRLSEWELRRRDDGISTICGYYVGSNEPRSSAITCGGGEFCGLDRSLGIVGCCTGTNPRGCVVPTTCLESSNSAEWSGDPLTTYCGDPDRPHCVTHSYDANFYDPLYGAYFVGCAANTLSGNIVASLTSGADSSVTESQPTVTSTNGTVATTATVSNPGNIDSSTTASPGPGESSGSSKSSGSSRNAAIAGGVVGGVAGLALILGAIFFCLYRRKKRTQQQYAVPVPPALGRKFPPSDHDMYENEAIPGSQYPSTFYGEAPPGMAQMSEQPVPGPPNAYGAPHTAYMIGGDHTPHPETPVYAPPQTAQPRPRDDSVSPLDDSPVSPVSPADHYGTVVSALSDSSPPLQPLRPAVRRPQSIYAQYEPPPSAHYSPPPPAAQFASYHGYPEL